MLSHILRTFYRTVLRSRFQLFTVVAGLTTGMVVSLLIYVYVKEETSYDRHHSDGDNIFRVNTILEMEGKVDETAKAGLNTGEALMEFYSEVESYTQLLNVSKQTVRINDNLYASEQVIYADSNALTFFTWDVIKGNPEQCLTGPNKAVIAKSVAESWFGSAENAFGNTMEINKQNFQISAVFDDDTYQTHIPHKIFLSLSSLPADFLQVRNREYMWITTYNYIRLQKDVTADSFTKRLAAFNEKHLIPYVQRNEVNGAITFRIEPIANIHLDDKLRFDFPGAINPDYLKIFSGVGVLTLLIAFINYINLTTAKISKRVKEIGIRKCAGATRLTLIAQFLTETIITVFVSFGLAIVLLLLALPELNELTGKNISAIRIFDGDFILVTISSLFLLGLTGGIYPALLLSSFKPVQALKSGSKSFGTSVKDRILNPGTIRKVLVIAQFSISIFLIIGTLIIYGQFDFLKTQNLGFSQKQVLVIDVPNDTTVSNKLDVIKNKLLQIGGVQSVSSASSIPGSGHGALTMNVSQSGGSEIKVINTYYADDQFLKTLDIELKRGRFFSREFSTDPQQAFVINEAAAKFLGWEEPLEKKIVSPLGQDGTVVGVVKDFNYKSLHSAIEPLVIMNALNSQGYLLLKLETDNFSNVIDQVSLAWKAFDPSHPYEYFFLDEQFQIQYIKEERLTTIFTYFSSLAIFISCLGLIGLATFTNELKVKEIGIRKSLGASNIQIFRLLSDNFLKLILLANVLAWPVAYYFISQWLSNFAYRTHLTALPFVFGTVITFVIAFITISFFTRKAVKQDIVKALKYE